jgi:serine/threonine protein kinase
VVDAYGHALLIDFDISIIIQAPDRQRVQARMGTPEWQAPELHADLMRGFHPLQTLQSEIWSLGCVILKVN